MFLPTDDAHIVTRVLRLVRGVALVLPNGRVVRQVETMEG